jgi:diphthamide synthase (EF-2-diphthine--ammonia ligase)
VGIPSPCTNEIYERELTRVLLDAKAEGVTHVIFGDLFLEDIRAYRVAMLSKLGLTAVFPLWQRNTRDLAEDMIAAELRATITCVDPRQLDASFAGRDFDKQLLADLPASVDPCGERGEFHTFVSAGPGFSTPVAYDVGEVVLRDGRFAYCDLVERLLASS